MSDKMRSLFFDSVLDQVLSSQRNMAKIFLGVVCIVITVVSSAVWLSELWVVPALDATITASHADPVPAKVIALVTTLAVVALAVGSGSGKLFGLGIPRQEKHWSAFCGSVLVSFGAMLIAGTLFSEVTHSWFGGRQESNIAEAWGSQGPALRFLQSVTAGLFEEIMFVAVPAGLVLLLVAFKTTKLADIGKQLPDAKVPPARL